MNQFELVTIEMTSFASSLPVLHLVSARKRSAEPVYTSSRQAVRGVAIHTFVTAVSLHAPSRADAQSDLYR